MVRMAQGPRTDDSGRPLTIAWDGTRECARRIYLWAQNSAYNSRFMWNSGVEPARTLEEHPDQLDAQGNVVVRGESAEWVVTPVGSIIERLGRDPDEPLRVHPPAPVPAVIDITPDPRLGHLAA